MFLDTNVWLSAVIFSGLCEDIVVQCAERRWLVSSRLVRHEAHEVLLRKFESVPKAPVLFDTVWTNAQLIDDVAEPSSHNDKRLIYAASNSGVDVFVTGDKRILGWVNQPPSGVQLLNMKVLAPREAWVTLFG